MKPNGIFILPFFYVSHLNENHEVVGGYTTSLGHLPSRTRQVYI